MPITLSMSNDADFDATVHGGAPADGHITFVTKRNATSGGLPAVVIGFKAFAGDEVVEIQNTMTLRELVTAVGALVAHHNAHDPAWQAGDTPTFSTL